MKCRSLVECVYYHGFTVMYFVCGLLYSMSCSFIISLLFAFCRLLFVMFLLIVLCFLNINFRFVFLFCVFFFQLCVLCVFTLFCVLFLPMYIAVYFLFAYNFTNHCHWVETQLQLKNIISYLIHQQPRHSM